MVGPLLLENDRKTALGRREVPEKIHTRVPGRAGRRDRGPTRGHMRPVSHVVRGLRVVVARRGRVAGSEPGVVHAATRG